MFAAVITNNRGKIHPGNLNTVALSSVEIFCASSRTAELFITFFSIGGEEVLAVTCTFSEFSGAFSSERKNEAIFEPAARTNPRCLTVTIISCDNPAFTNDFLNNDMF